MEDRTRQKKLLIIEDDVDILEILDCIFCEEGYQVVLSETGFESEDLSMINPDLILLDLRLSSTGREGATICMRLKSKAETCHIPIILLSAERDIKQVCTDCGADNYLSKPFDIDQLTVMVNSMVKN
ncbi:response regulator transcription factor [Mucilaginibacter sp.]